MGHIKQNKQKVKHNLMWNNLIQNNIVSKLCKPLIKTHYPNPFLFHISFMLDDDKIGHTGQRRNSQLCQIGPTIPTHMYSPNAT